MSTPALDARRLGIACLLGAGLGLLYGFLRPLRARFPRLADLLFLLPMGWCWLYLCFAVCRADIRIGYCAGLLIGGVIWEQTVGKLLFPVFSGFWAGIFALNRLFFRLFEKIFKKFSKKVKILFALWKKWFTIIWSKCSPLQKTVGGVHRDKKKKHPQQHQAGLPS